MYKEMLLCTNTMKCPFLFPVIDFGCKELDLDRRTCHINMEMFRLWLTLAVVLVSMVSCQRIQQSNDRSSTLNRTKQTNSVLDITNAANESRIKQSSDEDTVKTDDADTPHSRKKRLIWITDDGRLALPPGTVLSITPTLSLPLVRYPLEGFLSNMTMSFPLTIDFDKLGLTDNENPLGVLPPIFARKMGRAAGSALGNYIT